MAGVVFSDVTAEHAGVQGALFRGLKFWLAQRVPQRSRFVADVKTNGGEVVILDKQADIRIVDHARKEALPGTHSYRFIEQSIRNGILEDLEDHVVGPHAGTVRSIGSTTQPAKGSRNKFTQDDDRILWQWVQNKPQKYGGTDGNEIYKQLEAQNSRHPWQSWRDRWIKQLKGKPRPAFISNNAPLTPPSDHPPSLPDTEMLPSNRKARLEFSERDKRALLNHGEHIEDIPSEDTAAAWQKWSTEYDVDGSHSARHWEDLWRDEIRPIYLKNRAKEAARAKKSAASPYRRSAISPTITRPPTPSKRYSRDTAIMRHSPHRSPSYRLESPAVYHQSTPLPLRTPQKTQKTTEIDTSKSNPPQVNQDSGRQRGDDEHTLILHALESSTPHLRYEPRQGHEESKSRSPKRKLDLFEEEDLPSSSPPGSVPPMLSSTKRQRLNQFGGGALEIASTPENSPTRTRRYLRADPQTPSKDGVEVIDVANKNTSQDGTPKSISSPESEVIYLPRQASPTLSSPTRAVAETQPAMTQAIFHDPTQYIDLEVPPPDEGWDDENIEDDALLGGVSPEDLTLEPDPNAQLMNDEQSDTIPETQPVPLDTQGLLGSPTQLPDFGIADPDGGWDNLDIVPSSPPPIPGQRSSVPPAPVADAEAIRACDALYNWIESKQLHGYSIEDVLKAQRVTSTDDHHLADYVLVYMTRNSNRQIPQDEPGVWTKSDDKDLLSTDARRITKAQTKHGEARCNSRLQYIIHNGFEERE